MNQPLIVGATVCLVAHGAVLLKDLVGCSVAQSTPSQTPSTAPKAYGDEDEGFDDNEVIQTEQPQEHGYQGLGGWGLEAWCALMEAGEDLGEFFKLHFVAGLLEWEPIFADFC